MKLSPPITILGIVAAAFAMLAVSHQSEQSRIASSCQILTAFLKSETNDLNSNFMVVDFPDQGMDRSEIEWRLRLHPEAQKDPLVALYRQLAEFQEADAKPTELCPELQTWLRQMEIETNFDKADVLLRAARIDKIPLRKPIYSISMPAVNAERNRALLQVIVAQVEPGPGAYLVEFSRKADGNWSYIKFDVGGVH